MISVAVVCNMDVVQRHPGDEKCVTEILGEDKNKEDRGQNFVDFLCLKCSKTHPQSSFIPNFSRGDTSDHR